jgi:magnesium-transporting ATPase (P-type)
MTTLLNEQLETGDVIEISRGDDVITALVLLAADEAVILDACDGSTPFVLKREELIEYRKFVPSA